MTNISNQNKVPYQGQIQRKKELKDLNMMDAFLFDALTEKPEDAKVIARTIVRRVLGHDLREIMVESQKQFLGLELGQRGIRMDLWVRETETDMEGRSVVRLYDIEPNTYEDDLPKRSRYYQATADAKELPTSSKFKSLPQLIMIWILPYDPFGDDRMLYTVKNMVVENKELVYNDGVVKLFLYTKGKRGGSEDLKSLLTYFEETTQDNAVDAELLEIQRIVGTVKRSRETEDRYMTLQEIIDHEKDFSYQDGLQDGLEQGLERGLQQIVRTCQSLNQTKEKTIEMLIQQCNLTEEAAKEYISLYWEEKVAN